MKNRNAERFSRVAAVAVFVGLAVPLSAQQEVEKVEPEGSPSVPAAKASTAWRDSRDNLELVERIRAKIVAAQAELLQADMADYREVMERGGATFDMIAIPAGEFLMGSPTGEAKGAEHEGPQHRVKVAPFWMGKYEVTWEQFDPYVIEKARATLATDTTPSSDVDAVSGPTEIGYDRSLGMATTKGYPAMNMTQHCASKFCQWLSAQTGHYYRLPTEAEWEYACRAGTTTAYHFGDDPAKLGEYAVFDPTVERVAYEKTGTKKPNPWGLYDMHGNVCEFCLDQYFADGYAGKRKTIPAKELYPRVIRGGSWYDPADWLRSASRGFTSNNWKSHDPKSPRSGWFFTDAPWLGFRLVRPLEIPDAETMHALWNSGAIADIDQPEKSEVNADEK